MDSLLLDYYNQELGYFREMSGEFADSHPKIAGRLGMRGMEVADPFVERLIEAFCYLSARMRIRLDAEFPRFTQRLLEVVYPNYVAPTPSMCVVRLEPSSSEGNLADGFNVPKGTTFRMSIPDGQQTACRFLSGTDVRLWPLELSAASLGPVPREHGLLPPGPETKRVQSALRIRLRTANDLPFSSLTGLDELPFHLAGDEETATHLFELLHSSATIALVMDPDRPLASPDSRFVINDPVALEGFGEDQGLLPRPWNGFHGYNLVHEYFACPSRFMFLKLRGLSRALTGLDSSIAEVIIFLSKSALDLHQKVDASRFALFCTPAINLFPVNTDPLEVNPGAAEIHVVADRTKPLDFEIHSVISLKGQRTGSGEIINFRPLYETISGDGGNYGRYFSLRRAWRLPSERAKRRGTWTGHAGTEVFLSLVDQNEAPFASDLSMLSMRALVTNRDLPVLRIPVVHEELGLPESMPIRRAVFIRPPSRPRLPYAERDISWRLIRYLGLSYTALNDLGETRGGQAIRDYLSLLAPPELPEVLKQIQSLTGCSFSPVTRRLPGKGPLVFGRGVRCRLHMDESGFSGSSPYIFGLILAGFLRRHASVNSFTETELYTTQRGCLARWPSSKGTGKIL